MIASLKAHDSLRLGALRFLIAAIKRYEADTYPPASGKKISEAEVLKIVQRQVKTHRESIEAFTKGGRKDLVDKEQAELEILQAYVPKELTDAEIETIVKKIVAGGTASFGAVMGIVMKEVAGRADGGRVLVVVKKILA
jgi:hypothetical protein